MKVYIKFFAFVLLVSICYTANAQNAKQQFKVYGFIVYAGYIENGTPIKASYQELQQYLRAYGFQNLDLIYEQKMLDYPGGDKKNGLPNTERIQALARAASSNRNPDTPVSLDLEGWNRWDTVNTPSRMIEVINAFKKTNSVSKVGLYATVPQNTYAYSENISRFDKVNKAYSQVAASVDYFSPSLYNYDADTVNWNKAAIYNINACKKYNFPDKPILPYITPELNLKGVKRMLTYAEMMDHLQTLHRLGARGVLLWTSSGKRDEQGQKIYVDVNNGWAKAVKDFIATH